MVCSKVEGLHLVTVLLAESQGGTENDTERPRNWLRE
jgi:hypothetical protein